MNENVIKYVEEITEVGTHERDLLESYYVYLLPKTNEAPTSILVKGMTSYNKSTINIPLNASMWNPIVIKSIDITQELLDTYSIFVGLSYVKI